MIMKCDSMELAEMAYRAMNRQAFIFIVKLNIDYGPDKEND